MPFSIDHILSSSPMRQHAQMHQQAASSHHQNHSHNNSFNLNSLNAHSHNYINLNAAQHLHRAAALDSTTAAAAAAAAAALSAASNVTQLSQLNQLGALAQAAQASSPANNSNTTSNGQQHYAASLQMDPTALTAALAHQQQYMALLSQQQQAMAAMSCLIGAGGGCGGQQPANSLDNLSGLHQAQLLQYLMACVHGLSNSNTNNNNNDNNNNNNNHTSAATPATPNLITSTTSNLHLNLNNNTNNNISPISTKASLNLNHSFSYSQHPVERLARDQTTPSNDTASPSSTPPKPAKGQFTRTPKSHHHQQQQHHHTSRSTAKNAPASIAAQSTPTGPAAGPVAPKTPTASSNNENQSQITSGLTALSSLSNFVTETLTPIGRSDHELPGAKLFKAARISLSCDDEDELDDECRATPSPRSEHSHNNQHQQHQQRHTANNHDQDSSSFSISSNHQQQQQHGQSVASAAATKLDLANAPAELIQKQPAWVFCTRYSDRPSSGPRTRRMKAKEKRTKSSKVASDEKRPRTAFTSEQLDRLRDEFIKNSYLDERRRKDLAVSLSLQENQVKIWFQNKRAKMKKQNNQPNPLRGLLVAGGLYNHSTATSDCSENYANGQEGMELDEDENEDAECGPDIDCCDDEHNQPSTIHSNGQENAFNANKQSNSKLTSQLAD